MVDPKSTSEIQLIAQGAVAQQERVCQVKQGHFERILDTLAQTVQANSKAISDLAQTVAVFAKSVEPIKEGVEENEAEIKGLKDSVHKLTKRPAFWAAVGSALPVAIGVLYELIRTKP